MNHALAMLFRPKLSLLNGITALAGYLLFAAHFEALPAFAALTGVFLLASGGSAINQVLECELDSRMMRTNMRPLPRNVLTISAASAIGAATILMGLLPLYAVGGVIPLLLGGAALTWYLVVYTPLKTRTSLALPVGALCGAFPPLIGWCLAGGQPGDYRIMMVAGLMFLWQVPHFWLFQRRHAADYRQAGIPLFAAHETANGTSPFFWLWVTALCTAVMLLPAFGIIERSHAVWLACTPAPVIFFSLFQAGRLLFACFNCFPLLLTLLLLIQKHQPVLRVIAAP